MTAMGHEEVPDAKAEGPLWVVCHERAVCVQRCGSVREMKEGPSRPAVRCRSQATASCCRQERWWCCVKKGARAPCCTRDEGGPFGAVLEGKASNRHELLQSKAAVVNAMVIRR